MVKNSRSRKPHIFNYLEALGDITKYLEIKNSKQLSEIVESKNKKYKYDYKS